MLPRKKRLHQRSQSLRRRRSHWSMRERVGLEALLEEPLPKALLLPLRKQLTSPVHCRFA
jgi:hypothetical protein